MMVIGGDGMGRRRVDSVQFNCRLNRELHEKMQRFLEDPMKPGKVKHGSVAALLNKLLAEYFIEREAITEDLLKEMQYEFEHTING